MVTEHLSSAYCTFRVKSEVASPDRDRRVIGSGAITRSFGWSAVNPGTPTGIRVPHAGAANGHRIECDHRGIRDDRSGGFHPACFAEGESRKRTPDSRCM